MNVLIYADEGTSVECVKQTIFSLRSVLSPYYAVTTVTARQIIDEPWIAHTALLVMPGGADLPYCRLLNGAGNNKIKQYVRQGGKFLGICAGAYYGCAQLEFEAGTPLEVSGPRELAFYNGIARGATFKGFKYGSQEGAKAATVLTKLGQGDLAIYYNGGSFFEGDKDAEVLGRFAGPIDIESEDRDPAAIVYKKVGKGSVVLTSGHIEYSMDESMLTMREMQPDTVKRLKDSTASRMALLRALLADYLHLNVHQDAEPVVPHLSNLFLTSIGQDIQPSTATFVQNIAPIVEDSKYVRDAADVLEFVQQTDLQGVSSAPDNGTITIVVYNESDRPPARETPFFNHQIYYEALADAIQQENTVSTQKLGALLMYGEIVTSTHTMLEANSKLLKHLPHGLVFHGTRQTAGRGRGSNVWVNPPGVMAVTGIYRIRQSEVSQSLVFVQYIVALALIDAIKELVPTDIGVRLKWPNDVYIATKNDNYVKIGGIMVWCNTLSGEYVIVWSSGTNVDNAQPTTSLNSRIVELGGTPVKLEQLLAIFVTKFDKKLQQFLAYGFQFFEKDYYAAWLHSRAKVTLERYGGIDATITGISSDTGMLLAEDVYGTTHVLQPDGNSFDMLRGLIKTKR